MSGVFQTTDPPSPSLPDECVVYPPAIGAGGGHTRRAVRGVGGQQFGRRQTLSLYSIYVSTLCTEYKDANKRVQADKSNLYNRAKFRQNGGCGYVLKPLLQRQKSLYSTLHLRLVKDIQVRAEKVGGKIILGAMDQITVMMPNPKARLFLKITCKGIWRQVYNSCRCSPHNLIPSPRYTLYKYIPLYLFTQGRGGGEINQ